MSNLEEIKNKREFRGLPDSIIKRVSKIAKNDLKESRSLLRKYFGVFLTNKVLRENIMDENESIRLKNHISSKYRNYEKFYEGIFNSLSLNKPVRSIIDLGAGVNGFSYESIKNSVGPVEYHALEASEQLVNQMNKYFSEDSFQNKCKSYHIDLFNIEKTISILKDAKKQRVVFMFQIIDALEALEKDFSKKLIQEISIESERIVISLPTKSISGRKGFEVSRKWLTNFLEKNFRIIKDAQIGLERIIIVKKK